MQKENSTSVGNLEASSPRAFSKICTFGAFKKMGSFNANFMSQRVPTSLEGILRGSGGMSNKPSVPELSFNSNV